MITPTPRTFSDIFAPRAPLVLVKEYEDNNNNNNNINNNNNNSREVRGGSAVARSSTTTKSAGTSTTATATALATLKAIISQVQNQVRFFILNTETAFLLRWLKGISSLTRFSMAANDFNESSIGSTEVSLLDVFFTFPHSVL